MLDRIARPLAEKFVVSLIAMRIRLEKLALLHREVPHQRFALMPRTDAAHSYVGIERGRVLVGPAINCDDLVI